MLLPPCFLLESISGRAKPQAIDLIVPPSVQLGDRVANGPSSLAIAWQTDDADHACVLRFTQGGKSREAKATFRTVRLEGFAPHRVYTANLTGLKPGERLRYALLGDGKDLFVGEVSAPKSDAQPYTFAVFGDCGADTPEEAQIAYQTYLAKPDMLVMTGDLVYSRGRASEYRKNYFPYYTSELASPKNGAPLLSSTLVVACPGNHDILNRDFDKFADLLAYFYYWSQPLNGPLGQNGMKSTPTLSGPEPRQAAFLSAAGSNYPRMANYSYDYGNAHYTVLDANPYVDWTDPKMRTWLQNDLAAARKKTWRFVVYHQPGFHSSKSHQGEKQMRVVADLFEAGKVDVVFNGHVHNYQRSLPIQVGSKAGASKEELEKDDWTVDAAFDGVKNTRPKGVVYLVDGAGGADLYQPEYEKTPEVWKPFQKVYSGDYSFSIVSVKGKTFSLRQIDRTGKEIDRMTITK